MPVSISPLFSSPQAGEEQTPRNFYCNVEFGNKEKAAPIPYWCLSKEAVDRQRPSPQGQLLPVTKGPE